MGIPTATMDQRPRRHLASSMACKWAPSHGTAPYVPPVEDSDCRLEELQDYPTNYLASPIVRIVVGKDKEIFQIHKDILCHHTSHFISDLCSQPAEGVQLECVLDEVDAVLFGPLARSMYSGKPSPKRMISDFGRRDAGILLCDMWILAGRLSMPIVQDHTADALKEMSLRHHFAANLKEAGQHIWDNTKSDAKLRHLILDSYLDGSGNDLEALRDLNPCSAIAADLMNSDIMEELEMEDGPSPCRYHMNCFEPDSDVEVLEDVDDGQDDGQEDDEDDDEDVREVVTLPTRTRYAKSTARKSTGRRAPRSRYAPY